MSGCPHMSGMYTERHNVGGRILLKALLKGGRGADVVMHDIGHAANASIIHDVPNYQGSFATRIPEWVYTKGRRSKPIAEEKKKWDTYRPDILMVAGTNKRPIKRREVDVVEIKYCRDTRIRPCSKAGQKCSMMLPLRRQAVITTRASCKASVMQATGPQRYDFTSYYLVWVAPFTAPCIQRYNSSA